MQGPTTLKPEDFVNNPTEFDVVTFQERYHRKKGILNNVLEAIGNTPLIRLNKIPQSFGLRCEVLVKCEYFNPAGSLKDRIVLRMINDAEKMGRIKEGDLLVEPSSGNTSIGFGLIQAVKGYRFKVTAPDDDITERVTIMNALGVDCTKCNATVPFTDPNFYVSKAHSIRERIPGAITLNQYCGISNPLAHFDQTAEEILDDCDNKLDAVVCGTGTGGTITGIGAKIKQKIPTCKVVGVDPVGSIIAYPGVHAEHVKTKEIEGLGGDFLPNTCVRKHVDYWIKSNNRDSFEMARRLIKEEGLLVGGSAGAVLSGAIQYALENKLDERHRIVAVLPDTSRNYMRKFISDDWMVDHEYYPLSTFLNPLHKLYGKTVKDLKLESLKTYDNKLTFKEAIKILKKDPELLLEEEGQIQGIIKQEDLILYLNDKNPDLEENISPIKPKKIAPVSMDTDLSIVSKLCEKHKMVIVEDKQVDGSRKLYKISSDDLLDAYL